MEYLEGAGVREVGVVLLGAAVGEDGQGVHEEGDKVIDSK